MTTETEGCRIGFYRACIGMLQVDGLSFVTRLFMAYLAVCIRHGGAQDVMAGQ